MHESYKNTWDQGLTTTPLFRKHVANGQNNIEHLTELSNSIMHQDCKCMDTTSAPCSHRAVTASLSHLTNAVAEP